MLIGFELHRPMNGKRKQNCVSLSKYVANWTILQFVLNGGCLLWNLIKSGSFATHGKKNYIP